jgi:flagellar motor switch protein FliN/FliY
MQLEDCRVARLAPNVTSLADLMLHAGDVAQGTIALLGDPALRASLEKKGIEAHPASGQLSPHGAAASSQGPPLQRVIDVPLAVTLRFGQRQLTLRELLELNTGSLVELDRQVEEPVDLVLGERVIARGEVVIVDGNYGMRVTEVVENPVRRLSALA